MQEDDETTAAATALIAEAGTAARTLAARRAEAGRARARVAA
jgi:hypothetical protein